MPPDEIPSSETPTESVTESSTDSGVSQEYVDGKFAEFDEKLTHVQNAIAELAASRQPKGGHSHARPTPQEPKQTSDQQTAASGASISASQQQIEPEPERAPKPGHPYWRKLWGN